MKFNPHSRATRTDFNTSSSVTLRNSAPSDEAPKLRIGTARPVLPRRRVCISVNQLSALRLFPDALRKTFHVNDRALVQPTCNDFMFIAHFKLEIPQLALATNDARCDDYILS